MPCSVWDQINFLQSHDLVLSYIFFIVLYSCLGLPNILFPFNFPHYNFIIISHLTNTCFVRTPFISSSLTGSKYAYLVRSTNYEVHYAVFSILNLEQKRMCMLCDESDNLRH
jgi:hypothetical protein